MYIFKSTAVNISHKLQLTSCSLQNNSILSMFWPLHKISKLNIAIQQFPFAVVAWEFKCMRLQYSLTILWNKHFEWFFQVNVFEQNMLWCRRWTCTITEMHSSCRDFSVVVTCGARCEQIICMGHFTMCTSMSFCSQIWHCIMDHSSTGTHSKIRRTKKRGRPAWERG